MKGDKKLMRPLMTNSEQVVQFGPEQYSKCATALNILRETVMGPELLTSRLRNMLSAGRSDIRNLPISSAPWKMLQRLTLSVWITWS